MVQTMIRVDVETKAQLEVMAAGLSMPVFLKGIATGKRQVVVREPLDERLQRIESMLQELGEDLNHSLEGIDRQTLSLAGHLDDLQNNLLKVMGKLGLKYEESITECEED